MTLSERRLNESILRSKILKELSFLLEMEPGERAAKTGEAIAKSEYFQKAVEGVIDQAKLTALATAYAGRDFILFIKEVSELTIQDKLKILQLIGKDIAWIFEHDPVTATCFILDVFSVFDPTGLADIAQSMILFKNGNYVGAGLCLLCGAVQLKSAIAAVATEGVAIPLVLEAKAETVTLKYSLKFGSPKIAQFVIQHLLDPKMLNVVNKLKLSKYRDFRKSGEFLEGIIQRALRESKNPNLASETSEQILQRIFQSRNIDDWARGLKEIDSAEVKALRQIINDALFKNSPPKLLFQVLGLTASTSTNVQKPEEMRNKQKTEEFMRKIWCPRDKTSKEICDDIVTTSTYEHLSKSGNPANLSDFEQFFNGMLQRIERGDKMPSNIPSKQEEKREPISLQFFPFGKQNYNQLKPEEIPYGTPQKRISGPPPVKGRTK